VKRPSLQLAQMGTATWCLATGPCGFAAAHERFEAVGRIATDNEKDSIGSAHVYKYAGTRKQFGVSTADRIH
jgi:hypothetical protein